MIDRIQQRLYSLLHQLSEWAKQRSLPGFAGIPIWDVLTFIVEELKRDDIVTRANSMAFSFFLALFPSIIFIFTLVPYLPIDNFEEVMRNSIQELMPVNAHELLFEMVENIRSIPRGGLLSVGFVLAIVFASNGMTSMMRGFEKSYEISYERRHFLKKRGIALWLTLLVGILFVVSAGLIIGGNMLLDLLLDHSGKNNLDFYALQLLRWTVIVFLFYSIISSIYRFGPPLKRKFGLFSPGTTLATFTSILTSIVFSMVIDRFGMQSRVYGSLGALIVMLIWIQINCFILLVGYELNASIAVNRDLQQLQAASTDET